MCRWLIVVDGAPGGGLKGHSSPPPPLNGFGPDKWRREPMELRELRRLQFTFESISCRAGPCVLATAKQENHSSFCSRCLRGAPHSKLRPEASCSTACPFSLDLACQRP